MDKKVREIPRKIRKFLRRRTRGEIGKTADFVRRNIADMQKSFE